MEDLLSLEVAIIGLALVAVFILVIVLLATLDRRS